MLYRKKDDDSLVILKEITLHDLNAAERQMAMNEVKTFDFHLQYYQTITHTTIYLFIVLFLGQSPV